MYFNWIRCKQYDSYWIWRRRKCWRRKERRRRRIVLEEDKTSIKSGYNGTDDYVVVVTPYYHRRSTVSITAVSLSWKWQPFCRSMTMWTIICSGRDNGKPDSRKGLRSMLIESYDIMVRSPYRPRGLHTIGCCEVLWWRCVLPKSNYHY